MTPMPMPRILGREPALWLALAAVVVKMAAAFGLRVSTDQQALINAAVAAVVGGVVAAVTHDGLSAALLGAVQSIVCLAVGFGLHLTTGQQAVVMSLVAAGVGMWTRTQVTAPVPPGNGPARVQGAQTVGSRE